jgi:type III restriction enzyme
MNRHVGAIANRLSLRPPQRRSLEILDRVTELLSPKANVDKVAALEALRQEFPTVTDFEREFPSLCFALATGVGKTRLMGAFIAYLHLAHGINNFFVLAPNLTIYKKLIADFTPNTAKYVFKGVAEFAIQPPELVTGDTYKDRAPLLSQLVTCRINVFNISKINSEVRGGKTPNIKKMSEYLGESYFEHLAGLNDLVVLMDESHRYRASAGVRAINELQPVLGLELTATPFVETAKGTEPFKNVIYDYPLGKALADGFVKEPAVVTRKNFKPVGMTPEAIERLKLEDGVRLHESVKVELETYARTTGEKIVKPFMLIIARDTTHAAQLVKLIVTELFDGRYAEKVIQVDSSKTGAEEDEMVARLLQVESTEEPTEIVVHVNMLKEGWDVTNLYTIVPLRAANARILIEQSIGRGLRLPYGKRTGVTAVDRLNIVAHDKFQEIVDEANKPDSAIRLTQVILEDPVAAEKTVTVVSQPMLAKMLGILPTGALVPPPPQPGERAKPVFTTPADQETAKAALAMMQKLASKVGTVPSLEKLLTPEVQSQVIAAVKASHKPIQATLAGVIAEPDFAAIVKKTAELMIDKSMNIPRIRVQPKDQVKTGFRPFTLDLSGMSFSPPDDELWVQHLRTGETETIGFGLQARPPARLADYIVIGLMDCPDINYDEHSDMLYDLAEQVIKHLGDYLEQADIAKVLRMHQKQIAQFVHAQMLNHFWEDLVEYEVEVTAGYMELKDSAFTASAGQAEMDFKHAPADKGKIASYVFTGFARCLFETQKFQSDTERMMAVILDREAQKWFKPAKRQFNIYYRFNHDSHDYVPDFAVETATHMYMLETKAKKDLTDPEVLAKKDAAAQWCAHASKFAAGHGGKPWVYALIPHDSVVLNMTLAGLVQQFRVK